METKSYRPAGMSAQDRLNMPTECSCCGREGLKRTVKLVSPDGFTVWMGTGCAAKAMGIDGPTFRDLAKAADAELEGARRAEQAAETARWFAFLDAHSDAASVSEQITALGGLAAARAAYKQEQ
jgi:hypothetical protein